MSKAFKPSFGKKAFSNGLSAIPDDIQLSYSEIPLYPLTSPVAFPPPSQEEIDAITLYKQFETDLFQSPWNIIQKTPPKASWEVRYADRYNPIVTPKPIDQNMLPNYYPSELTITTNSVQRKKIKRDLTNILDNIKSDQEDSNEEQEEEVIEDIEEDDGEEEGDYQVDYYADDLDMIGDSGGEDD